MTAIDRIKSRRDRVQPSRRADGPAFLKLGGVNVWGENEDALAAGIGELKQSIEQTTAAHLTIIRSVLKKLVVQRLGSSDMDDKVFSAVLGAALRGGQLDSMACSSTNDKTYRVIMHVSQSVRWRQARDAALDILRKQGVVLVRDLELKIFGDRAYNTYSSASHVLARLNYLGIVRLSSDAAHFISKDLV